MVSSPNSSYSFGLLAMTAQPSQWFTNEKSWIIDTDVSDHMSPDLSMLTKETPYEGFEKIIVGNGEGLEVTILVMENCDLIHMFYILGTFYMYLC